MRGARSNVTKRGLAAALLAVVASSLGFADAGAAPGALTPKRGVAGCVSETGDGPCGVAVAVSDPLDVAVSPDGRHAYVASGDGLAIFDRAADGALTQKAGAAGCFSETGSPPCAAGRALEGSLSATVSPDGANVYVTSFTDDTVAVFDRAGDGTLAQKPGRAACVSDDGDSGCADGAALGGASSLVVSADGASVYVASTDSAAIAILDRAYDGSLKQKPGAAGCISQSASAPCGAGAGLQSPSAVALSPDDESVYVGSYDERGGVAVFDRAADGRLAQKRGSAGCISETGAGPCADGDGVGAALSVAVSPDGRNAYVAARAGGGAVAILDRAADGRLTQPRGAAGCVADGESAPCATGKALSDAHSVIVSPDGRSVYVAARAGVAVLDRSRAGRLRQRPGAAGCVSGLPGRSCVNAPALEEARSVTVSPDAENVYVASTLGPVLVFDRASIAGPLLTALSISPRRFPAARTGPSISGRGASRVFYTLAGAATVTFRIQRAGARGGRYRAIAGRFTDRARAGQNTLRFTGRLRDRRLAPGHYRLRARATDGDANRSPARYLRFTIVARSG